MKPFEATLASPGPAWLFVAVVTYQEEEDELYDQELGFHGQWHNLMVLSGEIFDEVTVSVDGAEYTVEAVADEEGEVTTTVVSAADAEAEVDESTRAKAIYAAGVRTQTLDGLFWRPGIAAIPRSDSEAAVAAPGPSSEQLLGALADRYAAAYVSSAPAASLGAGEVVVPSQLEAIVLSEGDDAAAQFATLRDRWTTLQGRVSRGQPLSFEDASALQSQLAYAERVLSPLAVAGAAVEAAQQAGWQSAAARSLMGDLAGSADCGSGADSLGDALGSDVSELDSELRTVLPVYGLAIDAAVCNSEAADSANLRLLDALQIGDNVDLLRMIGQAPVVTEPIPTTPAVRTVRLRVMAMLGEDGRMEHAVEFSNGLVVLPDSRYISTDAPPGMWFASSDVEVVGLAIGKIRARTHTDGRMEVAFLDTTGETLRPDVRYIQADPPVGEWFRSGEIAVPWPDPEEDSN